MSDKKSLFIPNKLRKIVKEHHAEIASNYTPEYNRLHDEGKLNYNISDQKSHLSLKEKLKEDFSKSKVNTAQPSIPRIGSSQELLWNNSFKKSPTGKAAFYDEDVSDKPLEDFTQHQHYYNNNSFSNLKEEQKKSFEKQSSALKEETYNVPLQNEIDEALDLSSIPEHSLILINSKSLEILHISSSEEEMSEKIENLLRQDFEMDDLMVLHKLKINVGVTLT